MNTTEIKLFTSNNWKEYELLDSGGLEKLERFNKIILRRPEPQALWNKKLSESEWNKLTDTVFIQKGSHGGEWKANKSISDRWKLNFDLSNVKLTFNLNLTSFKHIGVFPEQALNWEYIFSKVKLMPIHQPKVLNLFAYTGGASLAAKAAGADVTHVDSVKQVISWSKENMESSGLSDIRWVVEDAVKFVKREVKRGKKYNGIILDPPAYGIGASGERWKLDEGINDLIHDLSLLLDEENYFFVLNMYSMGLSPIIAENIIKSNFKQINNFETGEVFVKAKSGMNLPLGILSRFSSK
ncbi:MAG: class I SAM-dependent methyltransferase [Bacteroidota bacterium]